MKSFSISTRYHFYFLSMISIPMFLMTLAVSILFKDTIENKFQNEQILILDTIEEYSVDSPLEILNSYLENFSSKPLLLNTGEKEINNEILNQWKTVTGVMNWNLRIYYLDSAKNVIYPAQKDRADISFSITERDLKSYKEKTYWSSLYLHPERNEFVLSTFMENKTDSVPLYISIDAGLNSFFSQIKSASLKQNTKLLGLSKNGDVINFSRKQNEPVEYSHLYNWESLAIDNHSSRIQLESEYFYSFTVYLDQLDIFLVSLVPRKAYIDEIKPLILLLTIIALFSISVTLAGSYYISSRLLNNISSLNTYISRVAEGDFTPRICVSGNDEILDLNMRLNHMVESLGENIDLRETLLHLISHNSATPITLLLNNSRDLISAEPEREEYKLIYHTSRSLQTLMENMILYLKLEEDRTFLSDDTIDLKETTEIISRFYQPLLKKKQLEIEIKGDVREILGNRFLIRMALENLIDNAVKYSLPGGKIQITMNEETGPVLWTIKDNGPGIPESEIPHLFRKFSRISTSPTGGEKSTGLGLFLVKKIILTLDGKIHYSPADKSFTLQF